MNKLARGISIALIALTCNLLEAQIGPYADSLQVKTYVHIEYHNKYPKGIQVKKVFCNYCSPEQKEHVKLKAWHLAYDERFDPINVLVKGTRKLTLLIRVSKADFKAIKEKNEIN
jgi:hypothetical protein